MSLLELAFVFFYIGLFTIGGGLVAISLADLDTCREMWKFFSKYMR